ncbi:hypothetical protein [Enhygromyxa salina]|uniref:Uncharacterized protein n=1 Tax=Enhygromyxa salina TaxID=215803 RepID=A0A2S9YCD1_9BACT|nr:hypothetical protein [Enhygromyxa salina]PRQ02686.1 hypothetical protein ENSA7_55150 [Enhygromyxa salina]
MSEPASGERARGPVDRRALVREAVRNACIVGALISASVALAGDRLGGSGLAISIVLGTLLGAINLVLLARGVGGAIDRTVAGVEQSERTRDVSQGPLEPEDVPTRPRSAGGPVRLALVLVLVAALLWYPATEPLGLAIGVVLVLATTSVAGYRHERAR